MGEATNRYATAKGYFQSAVMIARSPERNSEPRRLSTVLSLNMLVGFALELYFKAWLLASGRSSAETRNLGHRIRDLFDKAVSEGLPSHIGPLVDVLAKGHQDFTFRYMNDGDAVPDVNWELAFTLLDQLDNVVDKKIGASAARGLPGH